MQPQISTETVHARPGCVLVAVRDYNRMLPLQTVLEKTNLRRHDIVVMTVRPITTGAGEYGLSESQIFSGYEKELFSRVVTMAEKEGKPVDLLVVPAVDPFDAMVQTAAKLQASRLVTGVSRADGFRGTGAAHRPGLGATARAAACLLAGSDQPGPAVGLRQPGAASAAAVAGRPRPAARAVAALERAGGFGSKLHHRDVVGLALQRLEKELDGPEREQVLEDLRKDLRKS